ncbi:unnamed protein product [Sphenostylis stenocarpa]|uniref:Uncharacterized protein n=1 Tax=Sphenostylis stenocarpa TaxID=92480 RepID=A0AA86VTP6_9FABA|nr:unnamed protein product [Sphenostylis stenocarpa]
MQSWCVCKTKNSHALLNHCVLRSFARPGMTNGMKIGPIVMESTLSSHLDHKQTKAMLFLGPIIYIRDSEIYSFAGPHSIMITEFCRMIIDPLDLDNGSVISETHRIL